MNGLIRMTLKSRNSDSHIRFGEDIAKLFARKAVDILGGTVVFDSYGSAHLVEKANIEKVKFKVMSGGVSGGVLNVEHSEGKVSGAFAKKFAMLMEDHSVTCQWKTARDEKGERIYGVFEPVNPSVYVDPFKVIAGQVMWNERVVTRVVNYPAGGLSSRFAANIEKMWRIPVNEETGDELLRRRKREAGRVPAEEAAGDGGEYSGGACGTSK